MISMEGCVSLSQNHRHWPVCSTTSLSAYPTPRNPRGKTLLLGSTLELSPVPDLTNSISDSQHLRLGGIPERRLLGKIISIWGSPDQAGTVVGKRRQI